MLERERCSPLIIVERAWRTLGALLLVLFYNFLGQYDSGSAAVLIKSTGLVLLIVLGMIALLLFLFWLSWRCTYISAVDDSLIYESGIIAKRKISIPISKINTIDKGQTLFQRIVGTETLKIDTGAIAGSADKQAEINLVFSVKRGDEIRNYILNRGAENEAALRAAGDSTLIEHGEPKWCIKASVGDFFMYGLTSSSVFKAVVFIGGIAAFAAQLSETLITRLTLLITPYISTAADVVAKSAVAALIVGAVVVLLGLAVVSNIIDIIWASVRFNDFRVARVGDNIVIRYGLISLKNYTLPVRNIHAVTIKQNLWQQLLRKSSIEIVTVGYGNEKDETALLFPIIANRKINDFLGEVLPEYVGETELHYSGRKGARYNVVYPAVGWGIAAAAAACGLYFIMGSHITAIVLPLICYLLILWSRILGHRHTAIGCNERAVDVQSGGFVKTKTHIRTDAVQSVATTSGIFKRRRNMGNLVVSYHAPAIRSMVMAKSFDLDYLYEVAKYIED